MQITGVFTHTCCSVTYLFACYMRNVLRFLLENRAEHQRSFFFRVMFLPRLCLFVCAIYVQYCDQRRNKFFPQTEKRSRAELCGVLRSTDLPFCVLAFTVDMSLSIRRFVHRQHSSRQLSLCPHVTWHTTTHQDTRASTPVFCTVFLYDAIIVATSRFAR